MKQLIVIVFIISVTLSSCNNNSQNNPVPVIGSTDSAAIAEDTTTQMSIENSYEYIKTLNANEKLVYDVIAYGGSAQAGEYAIIKRGADNQPDTIAHGERKGIIANTFLADLNKDGEDEIYIILQSADSNRYGNIIAYQLDKVGRATRLSFPESLTGDYANGYAGKDSIYTDGNFLIRRFPVIGKNEQADKWVRIYYVLNKNIFTIAKKTKE